jgi:crossover junction endodeoxyribonuclease RuvC
LFAGVLEGTRVRVLGIDPGLGCTGYAVVDQDLVSGQPVLIEAGAIRSKEKLPLAQRLVQIHVEISDVIQEFDPAAMALEDLYSEYRFPRTALLMAHARGAICLAAAQRQVPVWSYPAAQVKVTVVGHGAASKEQVQEMVARVFGLPQIPTPNDVADAMALALTAHRRGPAANPALSAAQRSGNRGPERE